MALFCLLSQILFRFNLESIFLFNEIIFRRTTILANWSSFFEPSEDSETDNGDRAGGHQPRNLGGHGPAKTAGLASARRGEQERLHLHPALRNEARKGL